MISIYVHIPYCVSKCSYCDFCSVPMGSKTVPHERYCGTLLKQFARDVSRHGLADRGVGSIYFGGGTPSLMPAYFFEKLMWAIGTTMVLQSDVEISCEVNPGTVDAAWFKRMSRAGINRFSIGVQTFQDKKLEQLGRIYKAVDAQQAIAEAQDAGGSKVSIDMMYGLPKQTLGDVEDDLKTAMTFQPDHISAYQLTIEKGTPFENVTLPGEKEVLGQLRLVRRMLASGGWEPYEISNFAKPSCVCRHNMHYWRYGEYLGIGCGAASFLRTGDAATVRSQYGLRWRLTRDLDKYLKGRFDPEERDAITLRTAMGEFCFLGLRTAQGVSLAEFEEFFGRSLGKAFPGVVKDLEGRKLVTVDEGRLMLTSRGVELSNQVFEAFVE